MSGRDESSSQEDLGNERGQIRRGEEYLPACSRILLRHRGVGDVLRMRVDCFALVLSAVYLTRSLKVIVLGSAIALPQLSNWQPARDASGIRVVV